MRTISSKGLRIAILLAIAVSAHAQQINLATQVKGLLRPANGGTGIDTSTVSGCPLVTNGVWSFSPGNCSTGGASPAGGSFAIQYANGSGLGGANFTGFVMNNGTVQPPSAATQAQLFSLIGGTPALLTATTEQDFAGPIKVPVLILPHQNLGSMTGDSTSAVAYTDTTAVRPVSGNLMEWINDTGGATYGAIDSGIGAQDVPKLSTSNTFEPGSTQSSGIFNSTEGFFSIAGHPFVSGSQLGFNFDVLSQTTISSSAYAWDWLHANNLAAASDCMGFHAITPTGSSLPNSATFCADGSTTIPLTKMITTDICIATGSPATCGSAPTGFVFIEPGAQVTTVNTTAVTANSQIIIQSDQTLNHTGLTCSIVTAEVVETTAITVRTPGSGFQFGIATPPASQPTCYSYTIIN